MTEEQFTEELAMALEETGAASVRTYEEAGVLTQNAGLVVKLYDGSQFQVTIVKSR